MRLLILLLILLGKVGDIYASEKLVADFKSKNRERVTVFQKEKDYGLELIISKYDVTSGIKNETRRVPNAFGVVLDNPSTIFMCWIANGHFFSESFQILDIGSFKTRILKLEAMPQGDEFKCLIEENEKYFIVFDNFPPGAEAAYLFNRSGIPLGVIKGNLKMNIEIEGKMYRFVDGHEFGGFKPKNTYAPSK